jgi:hypothetical protein
MARRYGQKTKTERTWKKISRMNLDELNEFRSHLEKNGQKLSKVYSHVIERIQTKLAQAV